MQKYVDAFFEKDLEILQRIDCAAFVLGVLACWRAVNKSILKADWKSGFLTDETFQDVVLSLNTLILLVKLIRTEFNNDLKDASLESSRLSYRFLEYIFAYCRML